MKISIHFWYLAELFLECKMFQTKVVEKIKTNFMLQNFFFFFENRACFWGNVEKYCRTGQTTCDSMANAHCMFDNKATNTPSEFVMLIAFALQQWLHKRAPVLRYRY